MKKSTIRPTSQQERDMILHNIGEHRRCLAEEMRNLYGAIGTACAARRREIDLELKSLAADRATLLALALPVAEPAPKNDTRAERREYLREKQLRQMNYKKRPR